MKTPNSANPCLLIFMILSVIISCKKDLHTDDQPITDIEGHVYKTVKIGKQIWMAENLITTKFNDGNNIPLIVDGEAWSDLMTPGYISWLGSTDPLDFHRFNFDVSTYREANLAINDRRKPPL